MRDGRDITDFDSIRPHFDGQDTVVHLAAALGSDTADPRDLVERNVWGSYNVFEAARQAGVRRVIFASSGSVILSHILESPLRELESGEYDKLPAEWPMLTHQSAVRPNSIYGVEQGLGGSAGALLRRRFGAFGHLRSIRVDTGGGPSGGDAYLCRVVQSRRRGADGRPVYRGRRQPALRHLLCRVR